VVNPHDALFRAAFADPREAAALIRSALPADIAEAIDWSTLRRVSGEFVDPELREHRADLLFTALMHGRPIYLYVVVEHRSTDQRFLAFDMLRYIVRILERHRAEHPDEKRLPLVLPLVVHHGERPMRSHRRLLRLFDLPREPRDLRRWFASHQPDLRLIVDDLARVGEARLRARALGANAFLSLYCLQFVRGKSDDEALAAIERVAHLSRQLLAESGKDAFVRLLSWLHHAVQDDTERLRPIFVEAAGSIAEELMTTAADRLIREGRDRGRAEGRAEGRCELVQRQLARRFGPLGAAHEATLRAASPEDLERWALRLLDAATIDQVFARD